MRHSRIHPEDHHRSQGVLRELGRVAGRGYALDQEENEDATACVGVPILCGPKYPIAALSLSTVLRPLALSARAGHPHLMRAPR